MLNILRLLLAAVAAAILALPAFARADTPLTLDGAGGDAWTFRKALTGRVTPGACARVEIASPAGTAVALVNAERFTATVPLAVGANSVQARCFNDGRTTIVSQPQQWHERLPDAPKAWVRALATANGLVLDAGRSEPAPGQAAPIVAIDWRPAPGNPASLPDLPATKRVTLPAPAVDGDYRVTLRITDALGRSDESTVLFQVRNGHVDIPDPQRLRPSWMADAVIYGVVPPLFGPQGLADVTARLDAIAALGINTLWLSPLTDAPGRDFGYAVTDHFRLRARFGSTDDLRALVAAAHARGMRVVMDIVPNHLDERSAYFADAAANGPASPYYRFFERRPDGTAAHYFDWTNLENLDYDNPEVRAYMTAAFTHWVRTVGIDGFRVDASWAVKERAPEFWPALRAELRRINPDLLLLAEASARDPWYTENGFDAAYDWTDQLGRWAWESAFEAGAPTATRLRAAVSANRPETPVFRFLNNNDTGTRFIARHGPARTRLAATLLLTLPGLPGLYSGDEVGAVYEPYGDPAPLAWDDPQGLRTIHARLIALRHTEAALRSAGLDWIDTARPDTLLAYRRPGAEPVTVVLNFSDTPAEAPPLTGPMRDLLTGTTITPGATAPPLTAWVLKATGAQTAERP